MLEGAIRTVVLSVVTSILAAAGGVATAGGVVSPSAQNYTVTMTYDSSTRKLTGTETVAFTNARSTTLSNVHLRLWPNGQTTCSGAFVVVNSVTGGTAGNLAAGCTDLPITLASPLAPGASGQITASFTDTVPKNWNFRYGISGSAAMLGNAIPILALTDDAGTHLEPYTINGESMYSAVASWNVTLTIPAGQTAATTGTVTSQTTLSDGRTKLTISAPSERDFAMSIGTFTVSTTTASGVRIRYFKQSKSNVAASTVLGWASDAVNSFTSHYGAFNQPEIDLAGGTWNANGFEFPGMLMIEPSKDIVYHEIAHEWWYSMVGDNQWVDPWVDESFAEFSNQRLQGTNTTCSSDPFAGVAGNLPLNSTMGTFDAQGHYAGTVYIGGACVLENLRRDWGDARFDAFMAGLQNSFRNGVETTCDVIGVLRANAPAGYDVNAFLVKARLNTAGC